MKITKYPDGVKCHVKDCRCKAAPQPHKRGLCASCYQTASKAVKGGKTTWDHLVSIGACRHNPVHGGEAVLAAIEEQAPLQRDKATMEEMTSMTGPRVNSQRGELSGTGALPGLKRPVQVPAQTHLFGCDTRARDAMVRIAVAQEVMRDQLTTINDNVANTRAMVNKLAKEWGVK